MKRFAKTLLLALSFSIMPTSIWAQDDMLSANKAQNAIIRDYENGFLFNVFEIENVEERVQLASALAISDIWICNPTDNPGELYIRPNSYNVDIPIYAEFDFLRMTLREEYEEASSLPKEEFAEILNSWAQNISAEYYNFLISDHLDRANHCMDAEPFCTSNVYEFPALNSGYSWSGPNYGCLNESPTTHHSFWYYMRIGVAGNITIKIEANFDVDFALWGPFSNQTDPCPTAAGQAGMLTATCSSCPNNTSSSANYPYGNLHDCSFDARHYEYAHIVNGQVGQYYILLITNWSGSSGNITFQKYAGDGETDCGIMPPLVNNDGPYCVGQTIHLTANGQSGATYSWTGPAGFSSNQQNPTRPNCTMNMAGTYTCTISLGGQTNSATTDVVIYPQPTANFTFNSVCQGTPTQFTSTSTTNPAGQQITSYQWNFGDGQTSTQQNPLHTYANAGTYTVTLTVACGNGLCTSTKTQTVTVYAEPTANAGPDQTIPYGATAQLSGSGGAGTFNFHWEPANMVVNPNAQNTQTVPLTADQTYTLTVTNPQGNCSNTDEVTIHISGSSMTVTANATPPFICEGGSTQLQANAGGGSGEFTFAWTPTTNLSNPDIYNPIANPTETTTYTCHVTDVLASYSIDVNVTVIVHHAGFSEETHYICPDDLYEWHDQIYSDIGDYEYLTQTQYGCDSTVTLHLRHYPTYDETTLEEAICYGEQYVFYGTAYSMSGQYAHTDHTIHGCDSIVRLNLTVYPDNGVTQKPVTVCPEQLPYNFYGVNYFEETDVTVLDTDVHGCDSAVRLILTVSDYYMPEIVTKYVCYEDTPYYEWYIPEAGTTLTYTEPGLHIDTLPTPNCDGIFRLNLQFQQIPETVVIDTTVCDNFTWHMTGETFTQSGEYYHRIPLSPFPCEQVYKLDLTVNKSDLSAEQSFSNQCDSIPFNWMGETIYFKSNGVYPLSGETTHSCDSLMTVVISNMKYTPNPSKIRCSDGSAVVFGDTIAVVTNTEFFSFQYTFYVEESNRECVWQSCDWTISKPSWNIVFSPTPTLSHNGKYYSECTVYVADRQEENVVLTATIHNGCGTEERKFYLKSSFLDVEENNDAIANVNIVPNPNNGQMHIDFENMEGRTSIKVFDMTGNQIDAFETFVNSSRYNYDYNMKRYAEGIYFFVVSNNNRVLTKKVVIIH